MRSSKPSPLTRARVCVCPRTGVEFAGEILTDMPGKKITLVQSGPRLFAGGTPPLPDKVRARSQPRLTPALAKQTRTSSCRANAHIFFTGCGEEEPEALTQLAACDPSAAQYAESVAQFLRGKGVTLIFDDKVDTRGCAGSSPSAPRLKNPLCTPRRACSRRIRLALAGRRCLV